MQNKILNPSSPYKGVKRRQRSELPRLSQGDDAVFSQTQAARKDWQLLGMFWHSSAVYMKLLQLQLCIHLLVMHHFPLTAGSVGRVVKDHKLFCTSRWLLLLLPPTKEVNVFPRVRLSVCLLAILLKNASMDLEKCCVSTDVWTWTNWWARSGLLSRISYKWCYTELRNFTSGEKSPYTYCRLAAAARRGFKVVLFIEPLEHLSEVRAL